MKKRGIFAVILLFALVLTGARVLLRQNGPAPQAAVSASADIAAYSVLLLVNKDNPLPEGYNPELKWLKNGRNCVRADIYDDLSAMLTAGSDAGCRFVVASAYRDAAYQAQLLEEDVQAFARAGHSQEEARREAMRTTMPAGHSEHETGLALDIVSVDNQRLEEAQEDTPENQWLRENCWKYGFILRYPRGKESITGIDYEPWHFRYVGREAAGEITRLGLTLEEYVADFCK